MFCHSLAQYSFKSGIEQPIQRKCHGNSKDSSSKPYIRTWASMKESVKNASELVQRHDAVHKVIVDDLGGIAACSSVGQIPCGRQQVKDLGKSVRKNEPKKTLSTNSVHDNSVVPVSVLYNDSISISANNFIGMWFKISG